MPTVQGDAKRSCDIVKMATGHVRSHERAELLKALVNRGDQKEVHREQLHQSAASCLEHAMELSPEVREIIRQRVAERDVQDSVTCQAQGPRRTAVANYP